MVSPPFPFTDLRAAQIFSASQAAGLDWHRFARLSWLLHAHVLHFAWPANEPGASANAATTLERLLCDEGHMSSHKSPSLKGSRSPSPDSPENQHPSPQAGQHEKHPDANIRNFAPVARIMKTALPENAKIAKEAKECMQECVSEFISFITSEGMLERVPR